MSAYRIGVEVPPASELPPRRWWHRLLGLHPRFYVSTDHLGVPFIGITWGRGFTT